MSPELFAGVRVRDYAGALAWYSKLLGEPSMHPHETEAVWEIAAGGSLYIVEDERGSGTAVAALFCDDLEERVAAIAERGIEPDELETYDNGVRKVTYRDPEGNEIGFGGPPTG